MYSNEKDLETSIHKILVDNHYLYRQKLGNKNYCDGLYSKYNKPSILFECKKTALNTLKTWFDALHQAVTYTKSMGQRLPAILLFV